METLLINIYAVIFTVLTILLLLFDGGVSYLEKKDHPLAIISICLFWPLLLVLGIIYAPFSYLLTLLKKIIKIKRQRKKAASGWQYGLKCDFCGYIADTKPYRSYCTNCGRTNWMNRTGGRYKIITDCSSNIKETKWQERVAGKQYKNIVILQSITSDRFINELLSLLEIEADGEEFPFLKDCLNTACIEALNIKKG